MNFSQAINALKNGLVVTRDELTLSFRNGNFFMKRLGDNDFSALESLHPVILTTDNWEVVKMNQGEFTFGEALEKIKRGQKVSRKGWNGKGMYLFLKEETIINAEEEGNEKLSEIAEANGGDILGLGTICMFTHDSTGRKAILTGWLASQSDMLSSDWVVVE